MYRHWKRWRALVVGGTALALVTGVGSPVHANTTTSSLSLLTTPTAKTVDGSISDWAGSSSTVAGTSVVSGGEFIYQDYLFDDTGKTRLIFQETAFPGAYRGQAQPTGTYSYPQEQTEFYPFAPHRCRYNCADLLEFRAAQVGSTVYFLVRLNTLIVPDSTAVGIAIGGTGSTPHAWPHGANISTPGTNHVLTLWGTGGAWDTSSLSSVGGSVAVSTTDNAIEASIPASLIGSSSFRAFLGTGLWNATNNKWQEVYPTSTDVWPGGGYITDPALFNVGFRSNETGHWFEDRQAAALTAGDISAFHADIDLAAADTGAPTLSPGYHQRIFESSITVGPGEGVSRDGEIGRGTYITGYGQSITKVHLLGKHQPYTIYLPNMATGTPDRMMVMLHGGGYTAGTFTRQPQFATLADAHGVILLAPMGRGIINMYVDHGHLDVLEAYDDATAHHPVDKDRTAIWGYSMGGFGVDRLITTQPDLFASGVHWAAHSAADIDIEPVDTAFGSTGNGNPGDLVGNVGELDLHLRNCTTDNAAIYPLALYPWVTELERLQYRYKYRHLQACEHLMPIAAATAADMSDDAVLTSDDEIDHSPVRVRYKTSEAWWRPDISSRLVFDKAYWVSGIRVRDTSLGLTAYGEVNALTHGLGGNERASVPAPTTTGSMGIYPYVQTGRDGTTGPAVSTSNSFEATLANLLKVTFDLAGMGLSTSSTLTVQLESDGTTDVRLKGAGGKTATDSTGGPWPGTTTSGSDLIVPVGAGTSTLTIS